MATNTIQRSVSVRLIDCTPTIVVGWPLGMECQGRKHGAVNQRPRRTRTATPLRERRTGSRNDSIRSGMSVSMRCQSSGVPSLPTRCCADRRIVSLGYSTAGMRQHVLTSGHVHAVRDGECVKQRGQGRVSKLRGCRNARLAGSPYAGRDAAKG